MELRHLRYFLAVADHLHFRRAAGMLHVSQPTLSLQIQQLEAELGSILFHRIGRTVRLTQAGELFRSHARRALEELELAKDGLGDLSGLVRGQLAIGVVQTVNASIVPDAVASFVTRYPGATLRVEELSADEIETGIVNGSLDLGVSFTPTASRLLEAEVLFDEELVLIVSKKHPWAKKTTIPVADLGSESLALLPSKFCTRRLIEAAFQKAKIAPRVALEMNTVSALLSSVEAGGPSTILPALAVLRSTRKVGVLKLNKPALRRSVGFLYHSRSKNLRTRVAFSEALQAAVIRHR